MEHIKEYYNNKNESIRQKDNEVKEFITSFLKDLEIKHFDKYPDSTFFMHKDTQKVWMEDDKKSGILWVSHNLLLSKIKPQFLYRGLDIKSLVKSAVETTFNMEVGTVERVIGMPPKKY